MRSFIQDLREEAGAMHKVFWHFPLSGEALKDFVLLRGLVKDFLGEDLSIPTLDPHLTILYMGEVYEGDLPAIMEAGASALASMTGRPYFEGSEVSFFPITDRSEGNQPIVLKVNGGVEDIHNRLLRALAPWVTKAQFLDFQMHITFGYLIGRKLTAEEYFQLRKMGPPHDINGPIQNVRLTAGKEFEKDFHLGPVPKKRARRDGERAYPTGVSALSTPPSNG